MLFPRLAWLGSFGKKPRPIATIICPAAAYWIDNFWKHSPD